MSTPSASAKNTLKITVPPTLPFMQSLKTTFDSILGKTTKDEILKLWREAFKRGNYAMRAAGKEDVKRESFTRICNQVVEHSYRDNWTASLTLNGLVSRHLNDVDFEIVVIQQQAPLPGTLGAMTTTEFESMLEKKVVNTVIGSPAFQSRMEDMNDRWAKKRGLDVDALAEVPGQIDKIMRHLGMGDKKEDDVHDGGDA